MTMPAEAKNSAIGLRFLNKLTDALNGKSSDEKNHPARLPITDSSYHVEFLKDAKAKVHKMRFIDPTTGKPTKIKYPCLKNLMKTIDAMIMLWKILRDKYGFESLNQRFVNQDPIENLFSTVRGFCERNTNPTPQQFADIFRALLINNLTSKKSIGSNCIQDGGSLLQIWAQFLKQDNGTTDVVLEFTLPAGDVIPFPAQVTNACKFERFVLSLKKKFLFVKACKDCKVLFWDNGLLNLDFLGRVFDVLKLLILPILPKIFNAHNISTICSRLIKDKLQFVKCAIHTDQIDYIFVQTFFRDHLYHISTYINKLLKGKLPLPNKVDANSFVVNAFEKYEKTIPKSKRT